MATSNKHIIRKQIIELELASTKGTYEFQQKVSTLFQNDICAVLDNIFSELLSEEKVLQLAKLEVDLGEI